MANTSSAKKALRVSVRKAERNKVTRKKMRELIKETRKAVEAKDKKTAEKLLVEAFSAIDTAAKKNVIHNNTASRYKSRLAKKVASLG